MSSIENNKRRLEVRKQLDYLRGKLSKLPLNDLRKETESEIKKLSEEYKSLPPEQEFAGDIYLSKKTVYEGERYRLRLFENKYWLYDDNECVTKQIEFDSNGEPVSAKVFMINSSAPEGKVYVYNFKIDQPLPEKPKGKAYKLKFHDSWTCPICNFANPLEYDHCYQCITTPRPENLAIKQ